MNITDFIVTFLQQGKNVEIPGVGTLSPVGQQIMLRNTYCNDKSIVKYIAEKECVSESIADMMWKNYVDALTDKLRSSGSHEFVGAGVMTFSNGIYGFTTAKAAPTVEEAIESQVIGSVKKYTKTDEADPFAVFEQPIHEEIQQPHEAAKPVVETPKVEEPRVETPVVEKPIETAPKVEEKPATEAPKAVEEPIKEEPVVEPKVAEVKHEEPKVAEKVVEEAPVEKVEEKVEEKPVEEKPVEEEKSHVDKVAIKKKKEESKQQKKEAKKAKKEAKKKKKRGWLIVLLILLLLCCGAGAYYYFVYMPNQSSKPITRACEPFDAPAENEFTNNTDLIEYTTSERFDAAVALCAGMEHYIGQYLQSKGYASAKDEMMSRVQTYANDRFDTLLSINTYSVRRFIPYEDYLADEYALVLKDRKLSQSRCIIVEELMENGMLRELLDAMVLELGLTSDLKAPAVAKSAEPALPKVNKVKQSKQGFDAIAGFYTSYGSAARMTASLKKWGCDAYIIEKNSGYYVSMGSASTRTAAEALVKHIKSWYDGDVVIKQID